MLQIGEGIAVVCVTAALLFFIMVDIISPIASKHVATFSFTCFCWCLVNDVFFLSWIRYRTRRRSAHSRCPLLVSCSHLLPWSWIPSNLWLVIVWVLLVRTVVGTMIMAVPVGVGIIGRSGDIRTAVCLVFDLFCCCLFYCNPFVMLLSFFWG